MEDKDPLGMKEFTETIKAAHKREENREALRDELKICIKNICAAEKVGKDKEHSYKYQHAISQAKSELLKVLKELEEESSNPYERNLLMPFDLAEKL